MRAEKEEGESSDAMVPNPVDKHGLVTRNRSADYGKISLIQHDMVTSSSALATFSRLCRVSNTK